MSQEEGKGGIVNKKREGEAGKRNLAVRTVHENGIRVLQGLQACLSHCSVRPFEHSCSCDKVRDYGRERERLVIG